MQYLQRQTRPLEMIRHSIMKLIEQIKHKRADILIICLLSSSNDLRTSCSKYQSVIFHSLVYLLLYIKLQSVCFILCRCSQVSCCLKASVENSDKSQNIRKLPYFFGFYHFFANFPGSFANDDTIHLFLCLHFRL